MDLRTLVRGGFSPRQAKTMYPAFDFGKMLGYAEHHSGDISTGLPTIGGGLVTIPLPLVNEEGDCGITVNGSNYDVAPGVYIRNMYALATVGANTELLWFDGIVGWHTATKFTASVVRSTIAGSYRLSSAEANYNAKIGIAAGTITDFEVYTYTVRFSADAA